MDRELQEDIRRALAGNDTDVYAYAKEAIMEQSFYEIEIEPGNELSPYAVTEEEREEVNDALNYDLPF